MNSTARRHCLRKDPARRFQIAADLKIALEDLKAELDSGAIAPAAAVRRKTSPLLWLQHNRNPGQSLMSISGPQTRGRWLINDFAGTP